MSQDLRKKCFDARIIVARRYKALYPNEFMRSGLFVRSFAVVIPASIFGWFCVQDYVFLKGSVRFGTSYWLLFLFGPCSLCSLTERNIPDEPASMLVIHNIYQTNYEA